MVGAASVRLRKKRTRCESDEPRAFRFVRRRRTSLPDSRRRTACAPKRRARRREHADFTLPESARSDSTRRLPTTRSVYRESAMTFGAVRQMRIEVGNSRRGSLRVRASAISGVQLASPKRLAETGSRRRLALPKPSAKAGWPAGLAALTSISYVF